MPTIDDFQKLDIRVGIGHTEGQDLGFDELDDWKVEFNQLIRPITDAFVSLESLRMQLDARGIFSDTQDELVADRGRLIFLAPDETDSYAVELRCGGYHAIEPVSYDSLKRLEMRRS